jgi:nucleoside 2-deoxyribosyltransferase
MKVFLSYRFTGEDPSELKEVLKRLCASLDKSGHDCFCAFWKNDFFNENKFTYKQILDYAFNEIDNSDCLLAFVKSAEKSEGMLLEIGYALAKKKKFILAIKKGLDTVFLHEMADQVIDFENLEELHEKLTTL